ncbi:MAG: hypothetical protein Q8R60_03345 [Mycobacteriales bacterium]|nr:hypothetical protein [Mycobacteriales bacterium]
MGSGLILLVIVGAWLAVLVPMALRSHDSTSSLSSVDRFSDAMRVLSRREGTSSTSRVGQRSLVVLPAPRAPAPTVSLAVRRRRTLLGLLAAAAVTLLGSLVAGPLLWVHLLLDALVVAFVVHCRRQAQLKAARTTHRPPVRASAPARAAAPARPATTARPAAPVRAATGRPAPVAVAAAAQVGRAARGVTPAHVVGIPDRMPARPAPLTAPLPAPAARHDEPVAGSLGEAWSPVPVPVPTYVTKAVAPPRRPRVLDLTKPGEWSATLDAGLDILDGPIGRALDDDDELDSILERRRAVGD